MPVGIESTTEEASLVEPPSSKKHRASAMLPPHGPLTRVIRSFFPVGVPELSRHAYRAEMITQLFMPLATACVEGGVVGVIARKSFGASDLAISAITAAPALSNLSGMFWTRFLSGRDRVRTINTLQIGVVLCVLLIAFAPQNSSFGIGLIVAAMLIARTLLTGIVNARADVWAHNYPRAQRARITGNLTIIATLLICTNAMLVGAIMDISGADSNGFRYIYAVSAILALLGVRSFSRLRVRGRVAMLSAERETGESRKRYGTSAMLDVLKRDRMYRRFMWAQFWLGAPVLASDPAFIIATDEAFDLPYYQTIALTQVIPIFVAVLTIPMWARFLDRTHIINFRAYHSWVFVVAMLGLGVGFLIDSLMVIFASRVVLGVANGGGMLAWNLGHHDFAKGPNAALYMGVHVTLTGVRGAVAPFFGTLLFSGASALAIPWFTGWHGLGAWTFVLIALVTACGAWMFVQLNREIRGRALRVGV